MKLYLIIIVATAGFLAACNRNTEPPPAPQSSEQDIKQKIKDSATDAKDAAAMAKDEFLTSMQKQLAELDAKILALETNAANATGDAKAQTSQALAGLRSQRDAVRKRFDDLKAAGQDAWDETKADFQSAWNSLVKDYDKVVAKTHAS